MVLVLSLLSALPSIQDTISPQEYLVAGPFLQGVREGGWQNLPDNTNYTPKEGDSLFSVLATNAWVHWEKVKLDSTGWLETSYPNVDWEFLEKRYGLVGLFNSGYAYTEIKLPKQCRALAIAKRTSFSINKQGYAGDSYANGYLQIPVMLKKGINKIWLRLGGAGDDRVYFKLIPVDYDLRLIRGDATLPDFVYGRDNSGLKYGAIPVSNTTQEWIRDAKLIVGGGDFTKDTFKLPPIAPMSYYKAPFEFEYLHSFIADSIANNKIELPISIVWDKEIVNCTLKIDCVKPEHPYEQTFISAIDSSVQYYAVLEPANFKANKKYSLIFALHGAGSKGLWHLGQYEAKDWCYMVGPTNRRKFGFDWQDWGRLDALEVYNLTMGKYPQIDKNKVCLTGHSMGGHGTWHVGLTYPDLFSCAAPGAGWTNHDLYFPWTWQKSAVYAEPWQLAIRNHALRGDNQLARLENALNLPYYIYQGGADDNVPAFQARLYAKRLNQLGYNYIYHEWPGGGHGWNEPKSPGSEDSVSCVNTKAIMDFFQSHTRNPYPEHIYYRSPDLSQNSGAYWLNIQSIKDRYKDAVIEGWQKQGKFRIQTSNIDRFAIRFERKKIGKKLKVEIDNTQLKVMPNLDSLVFEEKATGWQIAKSDNYPLPHPPIKGAYYEPFILVYGTVSNPKTTDRLLAMARNEAQGWWYRANGRTIIVPDTELTNAMIASYNLILLGNAKQNLITAGIEDNLPIRIKNNHFFLGKQALPPEADAALFIFYNPLNPKKKVLIREGIGPEGLKRSGYFSTMYSGAGLPDYIIWGKNVANKGWGGVIETGFFNADWNIAKP